MMNPCEQPWCRMGDAQTIRAMTTFRQGARPAVLLAALIFLAVLLGTRRPSRAEPFVDLYFGQQWTDDSDLHITQSTLGNDFTFHDVSLNGESFESPLYWGVRAGYFFERVPWLGVAVEYIHMKVFAETSDTRRLTGIHSGAPVDSTVPMNTLVQGFSISHGVNYVLFNAQARYGFRKEPDRFPAGRVQLYAGVGVGPVIVHPENRVESLDNDGGYQMGGAGGQVCVGARVLLMKYFGIFTEYKYTFSGLDVDVAHGSGDFDERSHHLIAGFTVPLPQLW